MFPTAPVKPFTTLVVNPLDNGLVRKSDDIVEELEEDGRLRLLNLQILRFIHLRTLKASL